MTTEEALSETRILQMAEAVRNTCVQAALEGYRQASISGLCHEGAWECAVGAMKSVDLHAISEQATQQPTPEAE